MECHTAMWMNEPCSTHDRLESHKTYVEQKRPDTKRHILYDSIYIKYENKQNESMVLLVRIRFSCGRGARGRCVDRANEGVWVLVTFCCLFRVELVKIHQAVPLTVVPLLCLGSTSILKCIGKEFLVRSNFDGN